MTDNEIRIEGDVLKQKVRDLNALITKQHSKSLERKSSASRIINKATALKEMGINILDEHATNIQIIKKHQQQLTEHHHKL